MIAGGLAVNAHGYLRFTNAVDIVLHLVPDNIERAFSALGKLGYPPTVPVTARQFADPAPVKPLYGDITVCFVSIPTLLHMKEAAGREQDGIDIEHLRLLRENDHD